MTQKCIFHYLGPDSKYSSGTPLDETDYPTYVYELELMTLDGATCYADLSDVDSNGRLEVSFDDNDSKYRFSGEYDVYIDELEPLN